MDRLSITDRLESTTPVRNTGPENSPRGDSQQSKRKRPIPKPEPPDETPDSGNEQDPHQLDELA